jgi:CheY-like chemotaxis protein
MHYREFGCLSIDGNCPQAAQAALIILNVIDRRCAELQFNHYISVSMKSSADFLWTWFHKEKLTLLVFSSTFVWIFFNQEIQNIAPSIIISDVNLGMGVMSGFSFYEKIIAGTYGNELKSVAFILMSSLEDEFFVRSAKQMGVKAYLAKPFTRESLETTVKNALA